MFAFALYDIENKDIYLARDRLGIKPLYWGQNDKQFMFASELKSIESAGEWSPKLNRNGLSAFMRHNYIPAPNTIYENVYKLEPGCILKLSPNGQTQIDRYWDVQSFIFPEALSQYARMDEVEVLNQLDDLLKDSVSRRMEADVPLGALLSGGIDSSLVAALMAEQSDKPINTFSIGFKESEFNEAPYAAEIAKHLGTHHTELYVEPHHALSIVEKLPFMYDEPFADSSQIPTAAVCELTKQHVTVTLSGDGGDELFAGYSRYDYALGLLDKAENQTSNLKQKIARAILRRPAASFDKFGYFMPQKWRHQFGQILHGRARSMLDHDPDALYRQMLSHWQIPDEVVLGADETKGVLWDGRKVKDIPDFLTRMQYYDTVTYLPDDILTKVDRASMNVSLEVRVPLLDHRVVEMAFGLPKKYKVRDGVSKWVLRESAYKRIPKALLDRPKMGFGVPFHEWLRGPLKDWTESLLDEKKLEQQGVFSPKPIREKWNMHLDGANWGYPLWTALMAQAWIDANPRVSL